MCGGLTKNYIVLCQPVLKTDLFCCRMHLHWTLSVFAMGLIFAGLKILWTKLLKDFVCGVKLCTVRHCCFL